MTQLAAAAPSSSLRWWLRSLQHRLTPAQLQAQQRWFDHLSPEHSPLTFAWGETALNVTQRVRRVRTHTHTHKECAFKSCAQRFWSSFGPERLVYEGWMKEKLIRKDRKQKTSAGRFFFLFFSEIWDRALTSVSLSRPPSVRSTRTFLLSNCVSPDSALVYRTRVWF